MDALIEQTLRLGRTDFMQIERFFTPGLAQVGYGVADQNHYVAAIIDPRRDVDDYLGWAEQRGLNIIAICETHVHTDFVSGARELAAATGAPIYAGRIGESQFPHNALDDGDVIPVGDLRLQAFWTPGHTPEHISYLLFAATSARPVEPVALFSGDILFAGEIGRPDLQGEEQTARLTEWLHETVSRRLANLPDEVVVYPGHGAGSPCGKNIGDSAWTNIGQEKRFNYAFQPRTPEEFAASVMVGMPRPPSYYPELKRINRAGPRLLRELHVGQPLMPVEVERLHVAGALLIDARSAADFATAHVPGSVNVGLDGNFATWAGWLTPYNRRVVSILPAADCFSQAVRELRRVGVDDIAGFLEGGITGWTASGYPVAQLGQLTIDQLAERVAAQDKITVVIDVREPAEWDAGHIPGSRNIPGGEIARGNAPSLPVDGDVAVICGSGYRSSIAASLLQQEGHPNVSAVLGGMEAWLAAGHSLV